MRTRTPHPPPPAGRGRYDLRFGDDAEEPDDWELHADDINTWDVCHIVGMALLNLHGLFAALVYWYNRRRTDALAAANAVPRGLNEARSGAERGGVERRAAERSGRRTSSRPSRAGRSGAERTTYALLIIIVCRGETEVASSLALFF